MSLKTFFSSIPDSTAQNVLPVVYSLTSALIIVYLAKKPVQLDEYTALNDNYEDDDEEGIEHPTVDNDTPATSLTDTTSAIEQVLSQYQASRSNSMRTNLARFGLTALQPGLSLFSLVILHSNKDGQEDDPSKSQRTSVEVIVQTFARTYALLLSLVHIIRPLVAFKLWIRTRKDFLLYPRAYYHVPVYLSE